jgi:ubiquinone/menaquinone biosynthesis C-methylase UbiE
MNTPIGARFVVPEMAVTHFHLREGDVVADFGAGSGFFMKPLAAAVGVEGVVYACEIQKALVDSLGELAHTQGLGNVVPLWCDLEEPNGIKINESELDAAILVNTLFMIEDKDAGITEMARTVRSGGKFFVIDWSESFAGLGPTPQHVITGPETTALFESHGFVLDREFDAGEHHYGLAFRKV